MGDPIALPPGVRLVHIGPHKTGTTALQRALHRSRPALHEQGVHYAYPTLQAYRPAISLTGRRGRRGGPEASPADWEALVDEVRAAGEMRVVISSESFANAEATDIARLRDDLGADRVHVVRMVRRYDRLAPSQWQQGLLNGRRVSLAKFCEKLLEPDSQFWRRHGFATLTRRWAEVVGPENVSVVVVDEGDPRWLLHVFERMLELADGTLPLPRERANRSLSLAEAETLRQVNAAIAEQGWSDRVFHRYVREGASAGFKRLAADAEAGKPQLPRDVHEMLRKTTGHHVEELLGLGVRVVGDVGLLAIPPWNETGTGSPDRVTVSSAAAASAAAGVVRMAEEPVPLGAEPVASTTTEPARDRPHRSLLDRRRFVHLSPHGPAGDFARGASGPRLRDPGQGRARHVLLTVVPPWQELAGQWQVHLVDGGTTGYADWLSGHPEAWDLPDPVAGAVDLVDPSRVVAVLADARFPSAWAEATGQLAGTAPSCHRSLLTWAEAEWLRELNLQTGEGAGLDEDRVRRQRAGAIAWALSQDPTDDNGAHPLDGELLAQAEALGLARRTAIERSGIEVVGDLDCLSHLKAAPAAARLSPRVAAWPILGVIASSEG